MMDSTIIRLLIAVIIGLSFYLPSADDITREDRQLNVITDYMTFRTAMIPYDNDLAACQRRPKDCLASVRATLVQLRGTEAAAYAQASLPATISSYLEQEKQTLELIEKLALTSMGQQEAPQGTLSLVAEINEAVRKSRMRRWDVLSPPDPMGTN